MKHLMNNIEAAKVDYFLNAYNELNQFMELVESDLKNLQEEKEKLMAKFTAVRAQDEEFKNGLIEKYGEGEISPSDYTFETID
jgi:hypothetical protein